MLFAGRRALTERALFFSRRRPSARTVRPFVLTASPQDTASIHLPSIDVANNADSVQHPSIAETKAAQKKPAREDGYQLMVRREKYKDLMDSLNAKRANPDLIWTSYVDLLDISRDEPLPLEIHQRVLRSCTIEPQVLRRVLVLRLADRAQVLHNPHRHEGRFLTVIQSIRKAGYAPTLEDYEFILTHFAAVGHHVGAAQVLQEVIRIGLEPRTKTFNLCLQTLAFRLSLPCYKVEKANLHEQCSKLCLYIVGLIRKRKGRIPSVCLDLILRVMKDSDNADIFKSLLRLAYGVDLDYLDRHPLNPEGGFGDPEPFSTAAFTTLMDFLGRQNQVSRMVAAFEVLSTPLSISSSSANSRNFDDDDDDDYPTPAPPSFSVPRPLPSARPNTTTYNTLIRHLSQRRRVTLAKHYLLQALEHDYDTSARVRSEIQSRPLREVEPQRFRVNIDTFRPVYSLGSRFRDLGLLKWLVPHFRLTLRRKRRDLDYYTSILENPDAPTPKPTVPGFPSGGFLSEYGFSHRTPASPQLRNADGESDEPSVTFFTPSVPSTPLSDTSSASQNAQRSPERLDVSLDPASSDSLPLQNQFDLALHVEVLRRDVMELRKLDSRIGSALSRLHIRRKEALGRRVWAGKNVFLRTTRERTRITREAWMGLVNFNAGKLQRSRRSQAEGSSEASEAPDSSAAS